MKKIPRRDKLKIYGDLLMILNDQSKTEKIVLTDGRAFRPLKNYISELTDLGLIEGETSLKVTEKGKQYLRVCVTAADFTAKLSGTMI